MLGRIGLLRAAGNEVAALSGERAGRQCRNADKTERTDDHMSEKKLKFGN